MEYMLVYSKAFFRELATGIYIYSKIYLTKSGSHASSPVAKRCHGPTKTSKRRLGQKLQRRGWSRRGGRGQKVSSPGLLCYQGLCYNFAGIVPMGTHPVCAILKYAKIPQKIMQNTPSAIIGMEIA